jgi:sulfonate transport system ATP-binding protein
MVEIEDRTMNEREYLVIENLNKSFETDGERFQVLEDINLTISKGEFVCIVGSSGCGKSTLLRGIAGLDPVREGSIRLEGKEVLSPDKSKGIVFQEHRLFPWMTVEQNVGFVLNDVDKDTKRKLVQEHLDLVGLTGFEKAYPSQLSGGMAQRAGIARALVNQPEILLLDEPFGALDAFTKIQMQKEVRRIHKVEETTMILVTHDIEEAVYLADRVVVLSARPGRIKRIVNIELSEPRERNSYEFTKVKKQIYDEFFEEADPNIEFVI